MSLVWFDKGGKLENMANVKNCKVWTSLCTRDMGTRAKASLDGNINT